MASEDLLFKNQISAQQKNATCHHLVNLRVLYVYFLVKVSISAQSVMSIFV